MLNRSVSLHQFLEALITVELRIQVRDPRPRPPVHFRMLVSLLTEVAQVVVAQPQPGRERLGMYRWRSNTRDLFTRSHCRQGRRMWSLWHGCLPSNITEGMLVAACRRTIVMATADDNGAAVDPPLCSLECTEWII